MENTQEWSKNLKKDKHIIINKKIILMIIDVSSIIIACIISKLLLSNEIALNISFLRTIIFSVIIYEFLFFFFDLYKNIIRYESGKDYLLYIFTCILSANFIILLKLITKLNIFSAKEIYLSSIITAIFVVGYRIIIRSIVNSPKHKTHNTENTNKKNLLIIGGGLATSEIIKTIKSTMRDTYNIVGIIDDDKSKLHYAISGVEIIGNRHDIIDVCKKYKVNIIFFAISRIKTKDRKEILNICQEANVKLRILPSTADLIRNKKLIENLRDVEIEDILGRDPIILDNDNISTFIKDKVVLVTGGGGSIGSELCRQIMKYQPKTLVIFDIYENNLYDIELELKAQYGNEKIEAIVGSVRDKKRLEEIFKKYSPYIVFHAAAHKHVPLMEENPQEAIKNNIFGTNNVVNCSDKYDVKRFVLISTDKAVNPTNIMGATKRMCEMIVQSKDKVSNTEFVAVRFGNVLGSNGSVVPLFKKQIANGGPVTVTHKEVTRFFMTIPEAVSLILQASSYAKGGEIYVLDMGEPVKIYNLAESLIKLSGLEPNVDIKIKVTGLRPGEKLYEELLMSEENLDSTKHDKIFIAPPMEITAKQVNEKLDILSNLIGEENVTNEKVKQVMEELIPTYHEEKKKENNE